MSKIFALLVVSMVTLSGCATGLNSADASRDVRAFALALRDRDLPGIEARIDRPALQSQVIGLARVLAGDEIAKRTGGNVALGMLGADLASPIIEALAKRALAPDMLADLARRSGLTPEVNVPGRAATALALQSVSDGRVCAPDPKTRRCLLYFGKYQTGWKLSAIDEGALRARLKVPTIPALNGDERLNDLAENSRSLTTMRYDCA
jgi:hypothetical protein